MVKASIAIIDIVILIVFSFFIYRGYKNGFLTEFTRALWTFLALILAVRYMSNLVMIINKVVDMSPVFSITISFTAIFASVFFVLKYLTRKIVEKLQVGITLGSIDRIVAVVFGLFKGTIITSLFTILLTFGTFERPFRNDIKESLLFKHIQKILPKIYGFSRELYRSSYRTIDKEIDECLSGQPDHRREEVQNVIDVFRPRN